MKEISLAGTFFLMTRKIRYSLWIYIQCWSKFSTDHFNHIYTIHNDIRLLQDWHESISTRNKFNSTFNIGKTQKKKKKKKMAGNVVCFLLFSLWLISNSDDIVVACSWWSQIQWLWPQNFWLVETTKTQESSSIWLQHLGFSLWYMIGLTTWRILTRSTKIQHHKKLWQVCACVCICLYIYIYI